MLSKTGAFANAPAATLPKADAFALVARQREGERQCLSSRFHRPSAKGRVPCPAVLQADGGRSPRRVLDGATSGDRHNADDGRAVRGDHCLGLRREGRPPAVLTHG